jgi:hypothetical protein
MKKCPQCQADYFDEMLAFCLEDGARLLNAGQPTAVKTESFAGAQKIPETMFFDHSQTETAQKLDAKNSAAVSQNPAAETGTVSLKQRTVEKGYRALETGTLVFALANNWWQWLYVERQSYGSASGFLFSADFLIWFLLLAAGVAAGFLTLKFSSRKTLAYAGLIILAINFLLILVPKK